MSFVKNSILCTASAIVGGCLALTTTPMPQPKGDCGVYKVTNKAVTSYVLKPPPAPPAEKIVVKEACVTKPTESDTQVDLSNMSETQVNKTMKNEHEKPHHRRHHRVRRYWR